jgi:regulator of sirC expression with transglutaminase-like and TPR domain
MSSPLPTAVPTSLQYFAALVAEDDGFPLFEAAIAAGADAEPPPDVQAVLAEVDGLAERLRRRLPADAAPLSKLRLLNRYFYDELGFAGNVNDYYDPGNSNLVEVLRTRRGIPITLALLWMELAQQVGLKARGVCFPGHFLVKLALSYGEVVMDPFTGQSQTREALEERLQPYLGARGWAGVLQTPLPLFLQAAAPREIVARLLHNLKEIHSAAGHAARLLGVMDRLVVLLPDAWEERRDRAFVRAELGQGQAAIEDLNAYLAQRPDAEDAAALQTRLGAWQRGRFGLEEPSAPSAPSARGGRRGRPPGAASPDPDVPTAPTGPSRRLH